MSSTTLPLSGSGPVRIQAYGIPAGEKEEIPIPPEVVATLDWDVDDMRDEVGLRPRRGLPPDPERFFRRVTVAAGAVRHNFEGASPLLSATQYFGPAPEPGAKPYIRLGEAAYWIASNGNRRDFFAEDVDAWRDAYDALAVQIQLGKVELIGRDRNGVNTEIAGFHLAGLKVFPPQLYRSIDEIMSPPPGLWACPLNIDAADWESDGGDKLQGTRGAVVFSHLQVSGPHVAGAFPGTDTSPPLSEAARTPEPAPGDGPAITKEAVRGYDDIPIFEAMMALMASTKASKREAAFTLAKDAPGGGTLASKADRLQRKFTKYRKSIASGGAPTG